MMLAVLIYIVVTYPCLNDAQSVFSPLDQGEISDPTLVMQCVVNCSVLDTCVAVNMSDTDHSCRYLDMQKYKQVITSRHDFNIFRRSMPIVCYNGGKWSDSSKRSCECQGSFTGDHCERYWTDCSEGYELGHTVSGVYVIQPRLSPSPFDVYCEFIWGGKTYIQLQKDGLNFTRGWQEYRDGFGSPSGDHWLGLKKIYEMCIMKNCRLQFHITLDCCPKWKRCYYYDFKLTEEKDGYRFLFSSWSAESAQPQNQLPDALGEVYGMKFSTVDRDNDESPGNCAQTHRAGWWFKNCTLCNPNGQLKPIPDRVTEPWQAFWESGDDRGIRKINIALKMIN